MSGGHRTVVACSFDRVDVIDVIDGPILVVDDEPLIRMVVTQMLEIAGHEVCEAEGGAQALKVLLDLSMPGMDGVETFRHIRERAPNLRVVIASGHFEEGVGARLEAEGAYLQKPYSQEALLDAIERR